MSGQVVVHHAGDGPGTWAMGSLFEHLVSAEQTGGTLGMSLVTQPPGIATPLHRHTREAEALLVLEGVIEYRAGDETYELTAGLLPLPAARRAARVPDPRQPPRRGSSRSPRPAG